MGFIFKVLDAIPVVGHVKGAIHYAVGDKEGCHKAMYMSTRTTAVMAGGFLGGITGGPVGAAAMAVAGGNSVDAIATFAMDEPQGFIKDIENVCTDIQDGRNPGASLVAAGVNLGLDAVGGLGMSGISSAITNTAKEVGKQTAGNLAFNLTAVHVGGRAVIADKERAEENAEQQKGETEGNNNKNTDEKEKGEKETGNKTSQSEGKTEAGSGSQPPEEKKDNDKKDGCNNPVNFSDFLKLLEKILEIICQEANREKFYKVFENLSPGQKKSLTKLMKQVNYYGATDEVLELVIRMFDQYFPSDFTFVNFLSMMEFVKTYIANKIEENCMISYGTEAMQFKQLVANQMNAIIGDVDILRKISDTFNDIRVRIETETANNPVDPNFRDMFAAVYHYFKHRIVPGSTLSVNQ